LITNIQLSDWTVTLNLVDRERITDVVSDNICAHLVCDPPITHTPTTVSACPFDACKDAKNTCYTSDRLNQRACRIIDAYRGELKNIRWVPGNNRTQLLPNNA
jgi:hypothetical protein